MRNACKVFSLPHKCSVNVWMCSVSHVQRFVISWTVACQAPLSVEFSRQDYWSGLSFPVLGHLPNPGKGSFKIIVREFPGGPVAAAAAVAKSLQSCSNLCDPIDVSPPGSPIPGILQARTLEWVAISFSNAWKWKVKMKSLSHVWLLATPWTAAHQAPPFMGFSMQEYWSGMPFSPVVRTL